MPLSRVGVVGARSWVIMSPGGPTPDKPDVSVVDYECDNTVSAFMRVDIQARNDDWSSRGAEFMTPPLDRGAPRRPGCSPTAD